MSRGLSLLSCIALLLLIIASRADALCEGVAEIGEDAPLHLALDAKLEARWDGPSVEDEAFDVKDAQNAKALGAEPPRFTLGDPPIAAAIAHFFATHPQARSGAFTSRPPSQHPSEQVREQAWESFTRYARYRRILDASHELSPQEMRARALELVDRASTLLQVEGVHTRVRFFRGPPFAIIEILPEGSHPMNRLASRLDRKLAHLTLAYDPFELLQKSFDASYDSRLHVIRLGNTALASLSPRDENVLHEARHAQDQNQLNEGKPQPLAGASVPASDNDELPATFPDHYNGFQGHDEPAAHAESFRRLLQVLTDDPESLLLVPLSDGKQMQPFLLEALRDGLAVSRNDVRFASSATSFLATGAPLEYEQRPDGLYAVIANRETPGKHYDTYLPLTGSRGKDDPRNREIAIAEAARFEREAKEHLLYFENAALGYDRMASTPDRASANRVLGALRRSLLRPAIENPKRVEDTRERFIERFNHEMDALRSHPK